MFNNLARTPDPVPSGSRSGLGSNKKKLELRFSHSVMIISLVSLMGNIEAFDLQRILRLALGNLMRFRTYKLLRIDGPLKGNNN
ncbi:hypothetical protein BHE74_00014298 [Ensete ventricosum]|nr:hypothetical protein BHE74_00014298 [Ensete ventricosum]RZR85821.1 hypothetical protein BHM03_00012878 [Ensete ventricosum]